MAGRLPAGVRVYTDLDHSLLGEGGILGPAGDEVRSLVELGVEVVPVTSKSVTEAYHYIRRLGLEASSLPAAVAESGAALVLAGHLEGLATHRVNGVPVIPLAPGPVDVEAVIPSECRGTVRPLSTLDPREASQLTGLPLEEARMATERVYDEALHAPDPHCRQAVVERAHRLGYTVLVGRIFVHVNRGKGKAHGVTALEGILGSPRVRVVVGDSPMDKDLLELPGVAVVIPRPPGPRPMVRPSRADYTVAPEPAPEGWVWMSRHIVKPLLPLAAWG